MANNHFAGKEVGYDDAIYELICGQHFHIHGMKYPDYTMMLVTTYGTSERVVNKRKHSINGEAVEINYQDIVQNHYTYQHADDDHNNLQKSPIRIEKAWATSYCHNWAFEVLTEGAEVNFLLALTNIYVYGKMETLYFQKNMAKELLNKTYQLDKK